ncbi:hypothetical protein HanRHA438_Chr11g0527081 [Helianthus annuus]|nr:hypothetical protein HanRHA438_Chr11g0527081 [Helianthus annuus]
MTQTHHNPATKPIQPAHFATIRSDKVFIRTTTKPFKLSIREGKSKNRKDQKDSKEPRNQTNDRSGGQVHLFKPTTLYDGRVQACFE